MNFNSKILKLSIILMLVLVLIPVVSAENSTDTFFEEYDVVEEEVCVEEHTYSESFIEEDAPVETSKSTNEIDVVNEYDQIEDESYYINESVQMNDDDVNVIVAEENSALEPQDIIVSQDGNFTSVELICSDISQIDNGNVSESNDDEITLESQSIDVVCVGIPVSKLGVMSTNFNYLNNVIFCGGTFSFKTNSYMRLLKNLDTKDDLLNDNWACVYYNVNGFVIVEFNKRDFNEKHIGDFAYSIDNSIVGDELRFFCAFTNFSYFSSHNNSIYYFYAAANFDIMFDEFLYDCNLLLI